MTPAPIPNSKGERTGVIYYTQGWEIAIFVRLSTEIAVYLGNGAR